ncbi:DUF2330 domain-containing protein [Undibacterium sp. Di27W]|uniref:DUF2330 domain-containing protein n=1 Tax=Undibacterium sp. Di27W TaxID=3413036 RepID=UPI003BF21F67
MTFIKSMLGAAVLALVCAPVSSAMAFCGFYAGKADASLFNEASQVVIARDGKRTVLSMLNDYKGPLNQFALIVPTPVVLQQGQVRIAERASFERLDAYSSPRLAEYHDADPCQFSFYWGEGIERIQPMAVMSAPAPAPSGSARDRALGVKVEAKYTLEEYDIVSLSAKKSDGLEIWLRENAYKIPKGTSEALRPYINQGMKFFVAKVNLKEQLKTGYTHLRPLQFAFESEKFMLPMRLGMLNAAPGKQQDLIIYMLTRQGRVESSNYRTAYLPANKNLPPFIKTRFQDFYKAMFDNSTKLEDYRVVFTEYFWDMSWCDPCADTPLSRDELRKAGVFWVDGDADQGFAMMQKPASGQNFPVVSSTSGAQQAMLTRLHVRYTPKSFPEDLMFTQTQDKQNWQARYIIQNPYAGNVAECSERVGKYECESMCKERVPLVLRSENKKEEWFPAEYKNKGWAELQQQCVRACKASKLNAIKTATDYYRRDLPERVINEKQTLANLTGWAMAEIDAMPGAKLQSTGALEVSKSQK